MVHWLNEIVPKHMQHPVFTFRFDFGYSSLTKFRYSDIEINKKFRNFFWAELSRISLRIHSSSRLKTNTLPPIVFSSSLLSVDFIILKMPAVNTHIRSGMDPNRTNDCDKNSYFQFIFHFISATITTRGFGQVIKMDSIGALSIRRWIFGRLWRVAVFGSMAFFVIWLVHWMGRTSNKFVSDPSQYIIATSHSEQNSE